MSCYRPLKFQTNAFLEDVYSHCIRSAHSELMSEINRILDNRRTQVQAHTPDELAVLPCPLGDVMAYRQEDAMKLMDDIFAAIKAGPGHLTEVHIDLNYCKIIYSTTEKKYTLICKDSNFESAKLVDVLNTILRKFW